MTIVLIERYFAGFFVQISSQNREAVHLSKRVTGKTFGNKQYTTSVVQIKRSTDFSRLNGGIYTQKNHLK